MFRWEICFNNLSVTPRGLKSPPPPPQLTVWLPGSWSQVMLLPKACSSWFTWVMNILMSFLWSIACFNWMCQWWFPKNLGTVMWLLTVDCSRLQCLPQCPSQTQTFCQQDDEPSFFFWLHQGISPGMKQDRWILLEAHLHRWHFVQF